MRIGDLSFGQLSRALNGPGLALRSGCFTAQITSPLEQVARGIQHLYAEHDSPEDGDFFDCHLRIIPARGLGRLRKGPIRMVVNGKEWYRASRSLEFGCLEWGFNWFIFRTAHHLLVIHAGCLERDGVGLMLPALPGSGKSTLTAALAHSGWRLFSDELAVINLATGRLIPLARPVCLKGESIPVIRDFAPDAVFGPMGFDRRERRSVAHVKPPLDSVRRMDETAAPGLIIYPQYRAESPTILTPVSRAKSFIELAQSAFNYSTLRQEGFRTLGRVMGDCESYRLEYSNLSEAVELINQLVAEHAPISAHV
jgi:HprK-related kinase A